MFLLAFLAALLFALPASAQINQAGVQLLDEGNPLGRAIQLNCVGGGIVCTQSGGRGVLTVSGGGGGAVSTVNGIDGDIFILGTASQIIVNTSTPNITLSAPQDIAPSSTVTFASATLTQLGGVGLRCVHANAAGTLSTATADCGSGAGGGVTSVNSLTGALNLANGTAVNIVSSGGDTLTVNNTGVAYITAGAGISVDAHVASVTITNTGSLTDTYIIAGAGISVNAAIGSVTVTNAGVTSAIGTPDQVNVSGATGAVTFSLPQNIATSSTPTFASVTATNAAAGSGFASCVQVNAAGTLYNTGASCTTVNTLAGRLNIVAGSNVTVTTTPPDTISIASTGGGSSNPPVFILPGTGISVNANVGSVTVTNTGVTSVATAAPITGGTITTTGTIGIDAPVNAQTGTSYTVVTGDKGKLVTHTNAAATSQTLGTGTPFPAGWFYDTQNRGVGTVTITPGSGTIDGSGTLALTTGTGVRIFSDGTNYFSQRGQAGNTDYTGSACAAGQLASSISAAGVLTCALVGVPQIVRLASDVVMPSTSASYSDVTGFSFTPAANKDYLIEFNVIYTADTAAIGADFAVNGPASPTSITCTMLTYTTAGSGNLSQIIAYDTNPNKDLASLLSQNMWMSATCLLRNGSTSSAFILRHRLETGTSATNTVKAGSSLRWTQLN